MDGDLSGEVTQYLGEIRKGNVTAKARLLALVSTQLRGIAERMMRDERANHTLQPTALVNELYLQIITGGTLDIRDQSHFYAVAATAMRRILIDYARSRRSLKRGGQRQQIELDDNDLYTSSNIQQMIELDQALERLERIDARQCRIVELRFFVGLQEEEIARLLGVTVRTVRRDWAMAKAWLHGELSQQSPATT